VKIVKLLLAHGADVNSVDDYGRSALLYAAGRGFIPVINLLLDNHADINLIDRHHRTVLDHAIDTDKTPLVNMLKGKGARLAVEVDRKQLTGRAGVSEPAEKPAGGTAAAAGETGKPATAAPAGGPATPPRSRQVPRASHTIGATGKQPYERRPPGPVKGKDKRQTQASTVIIVIPGVLPDCKAVLQP